MKTGIIIGAILAVVSVPVIIRCLREKKGQKSRFHKGVQTSKVETLEKENENLINEKTKKDCSDNNGT